MICIKKKLFKLVILSVLVVLQCGTAFAAHKKHRISPHKKKKLKTAHIVKPISRPDLKIVQTTAKPVLFLPQEFIPENQTKRKTQKSNAYLFSFDDPRESLFNDVAPLNQKLPQFNWADIAGKMYTKNGKVYAKYNNLKLELTINPEIQEAAERYLNRNHAIVSGSTAIIEPKTGRLLALTQGGQKGNATTSVSSRGPAASLIKIVTSAAAIEKHHFNPDFELSFRGGCGKKPVDENWIESPGRDNITMSFYKAFGSSCNPFFARLALYHVGLASLKKYAEKFMFNRPIPSDIKIQTSLFLLPDAETATPQEIAEAGSGFGATKLSPIHAALLSATIANGGIMMAPYLIEAAYNESGAEIYRAKPTQIGQVVSAETANKISTLMLATTSLGTSRHVFSKSNTQANIDDIGGKTGTLLDLENKRLLYTWFSGIASINSPQSIAIGTVVASYQNYVVRANAVAQTTIAEYLKIQKFSEDD